MSKQLDWQDIAARDPFLAGSIAARGLAPWDETTAEQAMDSVGLTGDRRAEFLRGWQEEIAEQERERKEQLWQEYEAMGKDYTKGDPAR